MRRAGGIAAVALLVGVAVGDAESAGAPPAEVDAGAPLEEIVVTGEFPGPGMWKITRPGDAAGHTLLIAADPWALPKRMRWKSRDIETAARGSQEILRDVAVAMEADEKIGVLRGLTLVPALRAARRNPDEEKLEAVLPPPLYRRWLAQKALYLGGARGVESWRPIFAADKLRRAAYDELQLRESGVLWETIEELAKLHKIKVTAPRLRFTFKRDEVREKIKAFSRESLADMECFSSTLDLTEALARRDVENARARAWAIADLDALAALPPLPNPFLSCAMAVMNSQVAREVIPADIVAQSEQLWLDAVAAALAANQTTFAIVPMPKLLREGGYLARLRAAGYEIETPK